MLNVAIKAARAAGAIINRAARVARASAYRMSGEVRPVPAMRAATIEGGILPAEPFFA